MLKHLTSICVRIPRLDLSPQILSLFQTMTPRPFILNSMNDVEQHVTLPGWNQPEDADSPHQAFPQPVSHKHESINGVPVAYWPQFSHLPTELRIKTWHSALGRHRMVYLVIYPATQELEDFDVVSLTHTHTHTHTRSLLYKAKCTRLCLQR